MKTIALVNTPECPCPGTHNAACMEFLEGFTSFGFTAGEALTIDQCCGKDILLLSSHVVSKTFLDRLNDVCPTAIYILWYYHNYKDIIPFKHFIITGEQFYKVPRMPNHKKFHDYNISIPNFVPLLLRANEEPDRIGNYPKSYEINGCFMGSAYGRDYVEGLHNIVYHDINRSGLLPYAKRREIHLKSRIGFGFHNSANVLNYHVTQRVFEALSYGCVVLTDNSAAAEMTEGIVEYVATKAEFLEKYNYYLAHPEECKKKEAQGYEWSRKYGTNRYAASLFLEKIKDLWGLIYTV